MERAVKMERYVFPFASPSYVVSFFWQIDKLHLKLYKILMKLCLLILFFSFLVVLLQRELQKSWWTVPELMGTKWVLLLYFQANITELHFQLTFLLCEQCPYSEFFWSVFPPIRIKYGEILRISPYSVLMRENMVQKNSEYGHCSHSDCFQPLTIFIKSSFVDVWLSSKNASTPLYFNTLKYFAEQRKALKWARIVLNFSTK